MVGHSFRSPRCIRQLELSPADRLVLVVDRSDRCPQDVPLLIEARPARREDMGLGRMSVNLDHLTDESLLAYYESIRRQVDADAKLGGRYRLVGDGVRHYAGQLQKEMEQRELRFVPIEWP